MEFLAFIIFSKCYDNYFNFTMLFKNNIITDNIFMIIII